MIPLALVVAAAIDASVPDVPATPSGAGPCATDDGGPPVPVDEAAPLLVKAAAIGRALRGLSALSPATSLEVDEQHTRFVLSGDKALAPVRLPLALPAPWSGTLELVPRPVRGRFCAGTTVVVFDDELRRAELTDLPVDVAVTITRRGRAPRTVRSSPQALVVSPETVTLGGEAGAPTLFVAARKRTLPRDELLEGDGAARYMAGLAALFPEVAADIRAHPSREAQRVLFAEMAASLRAELGTWTPERRLAEIARFDERAVAEEQRPLWSFWKAELGVRKTPRTAGMAPARLIVDDAVDALWIDGVEVFDRDRGTPTSVEVQVPQDAVRAWIVTSAASSAGGQDRSVVHDTRAVLRPGEIYSVTSTFVQHARAGTRRECVRVSGALPGKKDIRWREVSGARPAMLGDDETYRPSVPLAERVLTVVPGGDARPFPPVPLIYSYTHPGTYKWTLSETGGATLELIEDPAICKP